VHSYLDKFFILVKSGCYTTIQGNLHYLLLCRCISTSAPSRPPSCSFDDTIFELLLCSLTCSHIVPCVIQNTSSTLSLFLSLITLKVRLRYVYSHPYTLLAAAFCGGYMGCRHLYTMYFLLSHSFSGMRGA
jgi:hypothetical protein